MSSHGGKHSCEARLVTKLQLSHRTQVVIYALKRGLISLDEVSDISEP
jgi:hypothetical protein